LFVFIGYLGQDFGARVRLRPSPLRHVHM